ncbi:MAG: taurine dioxygenase [Alphaproteobacteria bacterium]|nr:taurine dioxygenase [Alphaproteobacteria bacterium]
MATIAATRPTVTKTTGTLGAEVEGIALAGNLSQGTIDWISDALVQHKVLVFRNQNHLTRAEHIAFGRRFGELEFHPFAVHLSQFNTGEADPEIIVIESKSVGGNRGTDIWHSDVTWRSDPSLGSILRCLISPESGGDTMWADMEMAYELLDEETKARIEGLEAAHDWTNFRQGLRNLKVPEEKIEELNALYPVATHPVVRTHPVSSRKCIYVNSVFTQRIVGMEPQDSDALLQKLWRQASIPEVQVRLRWRPGTVAFWDNRSTQHYAVHDYRDRHRLMERVTVCGDRPF